MKARIIDVSFVPLHRHDDGSIVDAHVVVKVEYGVDVFKRVHGSIQSLMVELRREFGEVEVACV